MAKRGIVSPFYSKAAVLISSENISQWHPVEFHPVGAKTNLVYLSFVYVRVGVEWACSAGTLCCFLNKKYFGETNRKYLKTNSKALRTNHNCLHKTRTNSLMEIICPKSIQNYPSFSGTPEKVKSEQRRRLACRVLRENISNARRPLEWARIYIYLFFLAVANGMDRTATSRKTLTKSSRRLGCATRLTGFTRGGIIPRLRQNLGPMRGWVWCSTWSSMNTCAGRRKALASRCAHSSH